MLIRSRAAAKSFCRTTRVPVRGRGRGIPKLDWGRSNVLTIDLLMPGPTVGKPASQKPLIDPWRLMSNFKRVHGLRGSDPILLRTHGRAQLEKIHGATRTVE